MRKFLNDSLYGIFTYSDKLMSYCLVMKWESGGFSEKAIECYDLYFGTFEMNHRKWMLFECFYSGQSNNDYSLHH